MSNKENTPTIIIKREGDEEAGAHGGAWKIAYADFMTAMMTFFLLMWLLNITTDEQRHGIAKFFNPMADTVGAPSAFIQASPKASPFPSLKSRPLQPKPDADPATPPSPAAIDSLTIPPTILPDETNDVSIGVKKHVSPRYPAIIPLGGPKTGGAQHVGRIGQSRADSDGGMTLPLEEQTKLEEKIAGLKEDVQKSPALAPLQENLSFQVGSDEIRIEMRDTNKKSMFDTGVTRLNKDGVSLLQTIAKWLVTLPEDISIIGETDGQPYHIPRRKSGILSNWTLSEMRADQAREVLVKAGYPDRKIISVIGKADRDLAVPDKPEDPANRRIVLVIHRRNPLPKTFLSTHPSPQTQASPVPTSEQPH